LSVVIGSDTLIASNGEFFVANESDLEKTEEPTFSRLEKARQEGDIPRSRELAVAVVLLTAGFLLFIIDVSIMKDMKEVMITTFTFDHHQILYPDSMLKVLNSSFEKISVSLSNFFFALMLMTVASSIGLGGWSILLSRVTPKFSRLNIFSGIKKILSLNALVEVAKAAVKSIFIGAIAIYTCLESFPHLIAISHANIFHGINEIGSNLTTIFFKITAGLVLIALVDVPYQKYQHNLKLRMTKQEVRQEYKESDLNPELKAKIRRQQREIANQKMWAEIPGADVILINPTHYSIAIKYREKEMVAPKVVAKGIDQIALIIQDVARESGVRILEAPKLARALFTNTEIGEEIPEALYLAVAEILAFLYDLEKYQKSGHAYPTKPSEKNIPDELDPLSSSFVKRAQA
jgi:flagellar biosynthetic protein FlhB